MLVTMSKLTLVATSTEPPPNSGSVTITMQSPSAGDPGPYFELEKDANGEIQSTTHSLLVEPLAESLVEPLVELLAEPLAREEDEAESDNVVSGEEEEASSVEEEAEGEEEREEKENDGKVEELQHGEVEEEKDDGKVEEQLPDEKSDEVVEEQVEEYEYSKEEVDYMKTAFVAYQVEKEKKKKAITPRKKASKKTKVTEIPISTLGSVLRSLGLNPTQAALARYADWLEADPKNGVVKFDEFLIIVGREKKVAFDESHVLEAFRSIDVEDTKLIPTDTLRELLVLTGEWFIPEEWIVFVHLADPKKTALVDYENFVARMGPNPPRPEKKKKGKKGKKKRLGKNK